MLEEVLNADVKNNGEIAGCKPSHKKEGVFLKNIRESVH